MHYYALQIFLLLYCRHSSSSSLSYASSARSSCLTIQRLHIPLINLYSKPRLNSGRTAAARRIYRGDAGFSPLFARSKKYGNLILFRYLEFPPNHLIDDSDVTLDYLHDLCGDVLIDVVWNRKAILTIFAEFYGGVHGLEK